MRHITYIGILSSLLSILWVNNVKAQTNWKLLGLAEEEVSQVHVSIPGVFFSGSDKGLYRSTDQGKTWERTIELNLSKAQWRIASNLTNDVYTCEGKNVLAFSTSGGESWTVMNQSEIISNFGNLQSVFVLSNRFAYLGTDSAMFRTTNYGADWHKVGYGIPPNSGILSFAEDDENYLWVGTSAAEHSGIFESTDNGAIFSELLSNQSAAISEIHITKRNVLLASIDHLGLKRSSDSGKSWSSIDFKFSTTPVPQSITSNYNVVYAIIPPLGIFFSRDQGVNWQPVSPQPPDGIVPQSIALMNNGNLLVGTNKGVYSLLPVLTSSVSKREDKGAPISARYFNGQITIALWSNNANPINIEIIDLLGRAHYSTEVKGIHSGNNTIHLNGNNIPTGEYFVVAKQFDQFLATKILIL